MRKIILLIISILIFWGCAFAFDDGDFQLWNTDSVAWKIGERWKMRLEEEFRFGNSIGDFYYEHSDLGMVFSGLGKHLDLGINYRQIFEEKKSDWRYENTPHFNITPKFDLYGISFSSRNRFELRYREKAADGWRYRNEFTIKAPKMTKIEIEPYIADEIFVDFIEKELNINRLSGGISFKIIKNLYGEIYYMWQSAKNKNDWLDYNILGTKLKMLF